MAVHKSSFISSFMFLHVSVENISKAQLMKQINHTNPISPDSRLSELKLHPLYIFNHAYIIRLYIYQSKTYPTHNSREKKMIWYTNITRFATFIGFPQIGWLCTRIQSHPLYFVINACTICLYMYQSIAYPNDSSRNKLTVKIWYGEYHPISDIFIEFPKIWWLCTRVEVPPTVYNH